MKDISKNKIIDLFTSLFNGYKLIKTPKDSLQNNLKETKGSLETSDVSISLHFESGKPKITYNTKKNITDISTIQ